MKRYLFLSLAVVFWAVYAYAAVPSEARSPEVREIVRAQASAEAGVKLPAPPTPSKPARSFGKLQPRELPDILYLPKPEVDDATE